MQDPTLSAEQAIGACARIDEFLGRLKSSLAATLKWQGRRQEWTFIFTGGMFS